MRVVVVVVVERKRKRDNEKTETLIEIGGKNRWLFLA